MNLVVLLYWDGVIHTVVWVRPFITDSCMGFILVDILYYKCVHETIG